ncbi:MAG: segregation/condensation protein A [Rhodospirillales bacterium]|nr:segregation/condensation protein A [Rhodospirillales bacterium]
MTGTGKTPELDLGDSFEEDNPEDRDKPTGPKLVVDIDGFEGPVDVLLALARDQKVDLIHVSILQLADQYLTWIAIVRESNLELAADYLVMAAWLAFLKSRLLLPAAEGEEEPSGEEMAAALQFQLQRLEAMQEAGTSLMARPHRGQDFHRRGAPDEIEASSRTVFDVTLQELLKAYGDIRNKGGAKVMEIEPMDLYSIDDALTRFRALIALKTPDWDELSSFLPENLRTPLFARSAVAATFGAALEMVKEGRLVIRQSGTFGPIYLSGNHEQQKEKET